MECRYNRCSICGFASECKVYAENKKAKEIIKEFLSFEKSLSPKWGDIKRQAEQFLGDEK